MPKPKSFLMSISVERAKRAHNCQHNAKHRILAGDIRVKLKVGRTAEYFCTKCALETIERDIGMLKEIEQMLETQDLH